MKKLINDPRTVVREMLEGLADMTPNLALLDTENVALRADVQEAGTRPVAVISGGGAGHEPAHAGYVGRGLLTAAVTGDVSRHQVLTPYLRQFALRQDQRAPCSSSRIIRATA